MTRRADQIIDMLAMEIAQGRSLVPAIVAATLCAHGLMPSEAGWVLHHVFKISMSEAVHIATVAGLADDNRNAVARGDFLPVSDREGPRHYAGA